jgi:DNA-binding NarL/FixJ family response regulator|tara:strand:- start:21507 stop:22139 length:633 start_codon:yes stop_codon:yes gene_type:complete
MINVLLVDDHAIVRDGLKRIIDDSFGMKVLDEARNGIEALEKLHNNRFDLVLLDISLPGRNGLEILKEIKSFYPKLPVLILTMYSEEQYATRLLKAGASGFLTKESASDQLVNAIEIISKGRKFITPKAAELLADEFNTDPNKEPHQLLSDREYQVLCMISSGLTVKEISQELALSDKTISTYRSRILQKMKRKNNAELTHYSISNGLIP